MNIYEYVVDKIPHDHMEKHRITFTIASTTPPDEMSAEIVTEQYTTRIRLIQQLTGKDERK